MNHVYALNNFIWQLLQQKMSFNPAWYGGRAPIIPSAEQPEFNNIDKPFIVYGYSFDQVNTMTGLQTGMIAYTVYDTDVQSVEDILSLIWLTLSRFEDSAEFVNTWIHSSFNTLNEFFTDVSFSTIYPETLIGASAATSEGGRVSGSIVLKCKYLVNNENDELTF